jgi:hypothetical protein
MQCWRSRLLGVALGRENSIRIGSQQAGPRVAALLSVVESCRRLSILVRDYLNEILPRLANRSIQDDEDLLPAARVPRHNPANLQTSGHHHINRVFGRTHTTARPFVSLLLFRAR